MAKLFTRSHEWIEEIGERRYRIGISDYAQHQMGDVVFVDLPSEDDVLESGETLAECESVKAVSEIYSPVDGTVVAVNEELDDNPGLVNEAWDEAWFVEVETEEALDKDELMDEDAYETYLETLA